MITTVRQCVALRHLFTRTVEPGSPSGRPDTTHGHSGLRHRGGSRAEFRGRTTRVRGHSDEVVESKAVGAKVDRHLSRPHRGGRRQTHVPRLFTRGGERALDDPEGIPLYTARTGYAGERRERTCRMTEMPRVPSVAPAASLSSDRADTGLFPRRYSMGKSK